MSETLALVRQVEHPTCSILNRGHNYGAFRILRAIFWAYVWEKNREVSAYKSTVSANLCFSNFLVKISSVLVRYNFHLWIRDWSNAVLDLVETAPWTRIRRLVVRNRYLALRFHTLSCYMLFSTRSSDASHALRSVCRQLCFFSFFLQKSKLISRTWCTLRLLCVLRKQLLKCNTRIAGDYHFKISEPFRRITIPTHWRWFINTKT